MDETSAMVRSAGAELGTRSRIGLTPSRVRRFQTNSVVDCVSEPLFATEVLFSRLNTDMTEQKLDLFELSARIMAQTGAGATKIVRRNPIQTAFQGSRLHDAPDHLRTECARADTLAFIDRAKNRTRRDTGGSQPAIHRALYVIESKPMEGDLIKVDAAALGGDIGNSGHVAVYGIYFDTGKADVKPESDAALIEIAKLLQQDSKLKLLVVGHTDNVGTLAANMDLSKRRAEAVVQVLTTKHGVAAARLIGQGAGPLAPVVSNSTEDGRAKNRRVELVQQ